MCVRACVLACVRACVSVCVCVSDGGRGNNCVLLWVCGVGEWMGGRMSMRRAGEWVSGLVRACVRLYQCVRVCVDVCLCECECVCVSVDVCM